jgi:hypothetical protein
MTPCFWGVMLHCWVNSFPHFEGMYCLHLPGSRGHHGFPDLRQCRQYIPSTPDSAYNIPDDQNPPPYVPHTWEHWPLHHESLHMPPALQTFKHRYILNKTCTSSFAFLWWKLTLYTFPVHFEGPVKEDCWYNVRSLIARKLWITYTTPTIGGTLHTASHDKSVWHSAVTSAHHYYRYLAHWNVSYPLVSACGSIYSKVATQITITNIFTISCLLLIKKKVGTHTGKVQHDLITSADH